MPFGLRKRDISVAIAAYLIGLVVAAAAAATWILMATSAGGDATVVEEDSTPEREAGSGRGEIAAATRVIDDRLSVARAPTTPLRGGLSLRVGNVRWDDGPRQFLRAASATGVLNLSAMERGDIIIDRAVVSGGNVVLDQDQTGGTWNYERVMAELLADKESSGPRKTVLLTNLSIRDTRVEVHQPNQDLAFDDIEGVIPRLQLSTPESDVPQIDVRTVTSTYTDLRKDKSLALRAEDARITLPKDEVLFKVARANVGTTRLADLEGKWNPATGPRGIEISGRALEVQLAELAFINERIPKEGRGSFRFAIRPAGNNVMDVRITDADVTAEGSRVRGSFALRAGEKTVDVITVDVRLDPLSLALVERMSGRDLPYNGTLRGTVRGTGENLGFNVAASITSDSSTVPFNTNLTGRVRLMGNTFAIQTVTANLKDVPAEALRAFVPNLPFRGAISGTVTLNGPPDRAPLNLNVRLEVAGGIALVNGIVDLTGTEPAYDVTGRVIGVILDQVLEPKAPPAAINANFAARGRGFKPETADAKLSAVGRFSGWRTEPHDTLVIAAHLRNGAVRVDSGLVNLGPVHLQANGEWRFVAPESGAIAYKFEIKNLAHAAPYIPGLPDQAAGVVSGSGNIAGSMERRRIEGELQGRNMKIAQWRTTAFDAKHTLVLGGPVPDIQIEATAKEISTPTTGAYKSLVANVKLTPPEFVMDIKADRTQGGVIEIAANGHVPYEGARRIVLQRARLDLGTGTWALTGPASIDWAGGDGVKVSNLNLKANEGEGRLALNGRLFPIDNIDVRLETAALPLGEVQTLLGREPVVSGLLWSNARIQGPGEAPTFNVEFRVDSGDYQGVRFVRAEGKLDYARQVLNGNVLATLDSAGHLDAKATLPVRVALAPEFTFKILDEGPASGSIVADSVKLALFTTLFPEVRDVEGVVRANATLSGTAGNPNLDGSITVAGGAATIIPLNRAYTDFNAEIVLNNRAAEFRRFVIRSGGNAEVTGRIEFPDISNPVANVTATLTRFRPAGVDDHPDAAASGEIHLNGPVFEGMTMTGHITMEDGDVPIPVLPVTPLDDELAELVGPLEVRPTEGERKPSLVDNVRIRDLRFTAGEGLWFTMPNARAQLAGDLTVNKQGEEMRVVGTLEGSRGTYTLEAGPIIRRFDVTHAELRFLGGVEIDPVLNITARRLILDPQGRDMEVEIRVGGTMKVPTLSLASQDAALIPQSELLSYLLFGQPSLGLSSGGLPGQSLVEETLLSGLTELASLELENAIGGGFDVFQVRMRGSGIEGLLQPTLVLGRELSSDVFLTVESGIGALFGGAENSAIGQDIAVRLEWRIDPRTSLRAGYEPVNRRGYLRGFSAALPAVNRQRQVGLELRRRWQW